VQLAPNVEVCPPFVVGLRVVSRLPAALDAEEFFDDVHLARLTVAKAAA
jgi:hypothetical protein